MVYQYISAIGISMRILVGMMHPKHVYMFKNLIRTMVKNGHNVEIVAIEKDITVTLLNKLQLPFKLIGENPSSLPGKLLSLPQWTFRTYKIAQRFKPDIFLGQAFPPFAYISKLLNKPYLIFEDTESAQAVQAITFPFASTIITPSCYRYDLGKKHIKFEGYFELAYLHPNNFIPNPAVLAEIGLKPDDLFIIIRFVSWQAIHDVGQDGIPDKIAIVRALEPYGRVLITSEGLLPQELEQYRIQIAPDKLHDLLYYATIYIGEGGTTASEAAILGTPSLFVSSLAGTMGNFIELGKKYQLLYSFQDIETATKKAIEIIERPHSKRDWSIKRKLLLKEKIDINEVMIWFVGNYPDSFSIMKNNPNVKSFQELGIICHDREIL